LTAKMSSRQMQSFHCTNRPVPFYRHWRARLASLSSGPVIVIDPMTNYSTVSQQ